MNRPPIFLTTSHAVRIHERLIAEFGGDTGIRDGGLLESAVAMPRATFDGAYLHGDLPGMAAAYHYHLSQNHPFVDGNKRVALATAIVFLRMNGMEIAASGKDVEALSVGLAEGSVDKSAVTAFYRERVRSRP